MTREAAEKKMLSSAVMLLAFLVTFMACVLASGVLR
jgi:hypothetical protein